MSNFTPLSELEHTGSETINWQVNLPDYAPSEAIGVNIRRLGRLARLGGFEGLRIASYAGEVTTAQPDIDSVDKHGNATASLRAHLTKAETYSLDPSGWDNTDGFVDYQWSKGTVKLNIAEIDSIVAEERKLRDPKAWSRQLDKALRSGMRHAAAQNLLEKPSIAEKIFTPLALGSLTVMNALWDRKFGSNILSEDINYYLIYNLIGYPFLASMAKHSITERRWSLIMGYNVDRVLAANGLSRALPLLKPIEKS